jgi:hypothetical protein
MIELAPEVGSKISFHTGVDPACHPALDLFETGSVSGYTTAQKVF